MMETIYCRHCGAAIPADSTFCLRCGTRLHAASTPPHHLAPASYLMAAFVVLALYLVLYVPGVVANLIFWRRARHEQRLTGEAPEGKGCLTAMLVVFVGLPLLAGLAVLVLIVLSWMPIGSWHFP